jgi:lipoprotein-anchoring transpeptidase ErfK/SrfK
MCSCVTTQDYDRRVPMDTARACFRVSVALFVGGSALALGPTATSGATKTNAKPKTTAAKKSPSGVAASSKATKPTTTTAPPPRSSGTPIRGWGKISTNDWPGRGDSVTAVAIARNLEVLRAPNDRTGALRLEQGRSMFGPVRLLALGSNDGWVRVAVPIRPNGTVGWVKSTDIRLQRNFAHIQVELSTNTMRVYDGDALSIETKVAAGTGGTPTPTGLFFVKELVPQKNPSGALGPFAFGLSGFSTVLSSFANGEGTIGIHGTNAPNKLGGDVSHGCVRVANANIVSMTKAVPLGTPVEIVQSFDDLPDERQTSQWVDNVGTPEAASSTGSNRAPQPVEDSSLLRAETVSTVAAVEPTIEPTTIPETTTTVTTPTTPPAVIPVVVPVATAP